MPRYFFWNEDGECHPDHDGLELPDHFAARKIGLKMLCDIVQAHASEFWESGQWKLTVKNRDGLTLFLLMIACYEGALKE